MNTFVEIKEITAFTGNNVTFYTLHLEDRGNDEFADFISRHLHDDEIQDQLIYLNEKLENFSHDGAKEHFFRPERSFHALPPPARYMEVEIEGNPLRLYCLYISNHMIFLFNGGIKTTSKAQDCENVGKYFRDAERFTKMIDDGIRTGELKLDEEKRKIINLSFVLE